MADKLKDVAKGPPMQMVLHDGIPTWANRTAKGLYRCTACKIETHPPVKK